MVRNKGSAPPAVEGGTLRPFHITMLALGGGGMALAAYNLTWLSFALPEVRAQWSLEPFQLALPPLVSALGGMIGSAAAGQWSDRSGRRSALQLAIAIAACSSVLSAASPTFLVFVLAQLGLGVGVNAMTPAATALVTELAPAHARGRMTALLQSSWVLGMVLSAAAAYLLIPLLGWRWGVATGGLAVLYIFAIRRFVPESPRFLVSRGLMSEALALQERIRQRWGVLIAVPSGDGEVDAPLGMQGRLAVLWSPAYRRRTAVLWALWFVQVFTYRGVYTWLPTLLVLVGQSAEMARLSLFVIFVAQLPATVAAAFAIDRVGRKPLLVGGLVLASITSLIFGLTASQPGLALVIGALMGASTLATNAVSLVYTPELYPTRVRATGVGTASAFGRIGAVIAPAAISALLYLGGSSLVPVFAMFSTLLALGAVVVGIGGEETAGRRLEEIAA